jgi:hypothetical protein
MPSPVASVSMLSSARGLAAGSGTSALLHRRRTATIAATNPAQAATRTDATLRGERFGTAEAYEPQRLRSGVAVRGG